MVRFSLISVLALAACSGKPSGDTAPADSTANGQDTGTGGDSSDTAGVDADGDGFTVAQGDCNDTNVYQSPARTEDPSDGVDNDCDGRIDEVWSGVDVAYGNAAGSSSIFNLDLIGRVQNEVQVDSSCAPYWLDHKDGPLSDGTDDWIINNAYAAVSDVSRDGTCTDIADFSDTTAYPYGVYGVATGVDGTIYATTLDNLDVVSEDGTITSVATWKCDLMNSDNHELAAYSLAVDPLTGVIALYGYFGGFATYDPATGAFTMLAKENWSTSTLNTFSGAHKDGFDDGTGTGGGWYTAGVDATTGSYAMYKFNEAQNQWVSKAAWTDEDWAPFMLAIDGDNGDYYVTANAGWYYTVWRIVSDTDYAAQLYSTDGTVENRAFYGIVSNY